MEGIDTLEALEKQGVKDGDTIVVEHLEFVHYEEQLWEGANADKKD